MISRLKDFNSPFCILSVVSADSGKLSIGQRIQCFKSLAGFEA
jgi:hypothetical protein